MLIKLLMGIFALSCLTDAAIAIHEFDHIGDMHIAWAGNSVMAAFVYLAIGFWPR